MKRKFITLTLKPSECRPQAETVSVVPVYKYRTVDGKKTLVETGKRDVHQEIQAAAVGVTVREIVARGLSAVPSNSVPVYGDARGKNDDVIALDQKVKSAQKSFENLPEDFRAQFNNDPMMFVSQFSQDYVNKFVESKMMPKSPAPSETPKGE